MSLRMLRQLSHLACGPLCAAALLLSSANARVVRVVVDSRESPALDGRQFGKTGQYERLSGRFFGELDPRDPLNAIIQDIALAPRNARGRVEYSATFTLFRPLNPAKASGVLWYEVPNRGNSPLARPSEDALANGHILLSSGWQGDIVPRSGTEGITVPVARNGDGSSITGPVLYRFTNANGSTASLTGGYGGLRYQLPATLDTGKALLTKQATDDGEVIPIPAKEWAFANCEKAPFPGEPDPSRVCMKRPS